MDTEEVEFKALNEQTDNRNPPRQNRWVTQIGVPTLTFYPLTPEQSAQAAVVICPGGGYSGLAIDKEGHDVARWLNSLGVTAVVLKYRVKDYGQPAPRDNVQRALAELRSRAPELGVKPDRIGVMGFSAGGHVASTGATHFRDFELDGATVSSRPDFAILVYPVISMDAAVTHGGSRQGLLGELPSPELVGEYSNELQVTAETPPTFLVHALDDTAVPFENSLRFYRALQQHKVRAKLFTCERGGHGFGLVESPVRRPRGHTPVLNG